MKTISVEGTTVQLRAGDSIRCVLPWQADVGESPVWHAAEQKLYWIDIQEKQVHRLDPATGVNENFTLPDIVTCIQVRQAGGLVLTLKKQFAFFDPNSGFFDRLTEVEQDQPGNRFNDGKCDPKGRIWAGAMDSKQWKAPSGHLYRMAPNREVQQVLSDVVCANGSGWSPNFVNTLLSALLAFAGRPVYGYYLDHGNSLGLAPLTDQTVGASIMWVFGSIAFLLPAMILLARLLQGDEGSHSPLRYGRQRTSA